MMPEPQLSLAVESGLYSGVVRLLGGGEHVIGSGLEADVVFLEDLLDPRHFSVSIDAEGRLSVRCLQPGLFVEDEEMTPGTVAVFERDVRILAGDVAFTCRSLAVSEPEQSRLAAQPARTRMFRLVALAALGIAAAILIMDPFLHGSENVSPTSDTASLKGGSPVHASLSGAPVTGSSGVRVAAASVGAAGPALEGEIISGLDLAEPQQKVALAASEAVDRLRSDIVRDFPGLQVDIADNVVTARGAVSPENMGKWRRTMQRVDEEFGGAVTLVNMVTARAEKAVSTPAIEAIWKGDNPYVVIKGERYFTGARLEGGWTFVRVEGGRVILQKDGALVALTF